MGFSLTTRPFATDLLRLLAACALWATVISVACLSSCTSGSSSVDAPAEGDPDDPSEGAEDDGDSEDEEEESEGEEGDGEGDDEIVEGNDVCHAEHDPFTDELVHTGASASGSTTVQLIGSVYELTFSGDEVLTYEIDLTDAGVQSGLLRVRERSSGAWPLWDGGPGYRTPSGDVEPPTHLQPFCTLTGDRIAGDRVELDYEDVLDGMTLTRRHTFELRGKTLRVRVDSLQPLRLEPNRNYSGIVTGRTNETFEPTPITLAGTLATPLVMFRSASDEAWFTANLLDLTQSRASSFHLPEADEVVPTNDSIDWSYDTLGRYATSTAGKLSAALGETLSVVVTTELHDAFVTSTRPTSAYRDRLSNRTVVVLSAAAPWADHRAYFEGLQAWGLDEMAVYAFFWWSDSVLEGVQNVGPDWAPAYDEAGFRTFVETGVDAGLMIGAYTWFGAMPNTSPFFQPNDIVQTSGGALKTANFSGSTPIGLPSDGALLDDVERETALLADYGLTLGFTDAQTYSSPAVPTDRIDQNASSPWPKTLRGAIASRKEWMGELRRGIDGPLLGEASNFNAISNMEWLWSGYCDSVQRTVNTGSGTKSVDLPSGSNESPSRWPVIPDYELAVARRQQANHGNGFYRRFFAPGDGSGAVVGGDVQYPLSAAGVDRYRLYELTYGHASFFMTNGHELDQGNYLTLKDTLKEYYLVSGLQEDILNAELGTIEYFAAGAWRTTAEKLIADGTTDTFRNPRLRISYATGLVLYLNHSPNEWTVTLPAAVLGESTYVLPEDGFLAYRPADDLLVLSGWTAGVSGNRFDYANVPGRWEFFDGRGAVPGYGNLTTQLVPGGVFHNGISYRNDVHNLQVGERPSGLIANLGTPPQLVSVEVLPASIQLGVGESIAVQAIAHYDNGAWRDVSTLVDWTATENRAHVTRGGAVTGCQPGAGTITAQAFEGVTVTPATVDVQ